MEGVNNRTVVLYVTAYPIAWRIDAVVDDGHRGFGHIRPGLDATQEIGTVHWRDMVGFTGEPRGNR